MVQRVCVVGAGVSGLAAAWALHQHPDRFDVRVLERGDRIGGNAMTVDVPQSCGPSVPIDISVIACFPAVYHNFVELLSRYGVELVPTRFSYAVLHGDDVYAHDLDSELRTRLSGDIARFRALLRFLGWLNVLNERPSSLLMAALNPFNYVSMGKMLDLWRISADFRMKILKPLFVNFVLTSSVFEVPASLFARYLDFFDVERSTPMTTWRGGTRLIYERMTAGFADRIQLGREVISVERDGAGVTVRDATNAAERYDQVVLACNVNHALDILARPSFMERQVLGRVRYENTVHDRAVVHTDGSVLPDDQTEAAATRSNFIRQYGSRPDSYEITYIMHNQQPWASRSDRPCLVTYRSQRPIDPQYVLAEMQFQHVVHDVRHTAALLNLFSFLQGRQRTWFSGAHTTMNSQEHCLISGLTVARQLGADYPFGHNREATRWFNFYGRLMHGPRFRQAVHEPVPVHHKAHTRLSDPQEPVP